METEARVVDDPVEGPLRVLDTLGDPVHVGALGQIGRDDLDVDAVDGVQFGRDRFEARRVAGYEDEIHAAAGELTREGVTDAGRATRDESRNHEPKGTPPRDWLPKRRASSATGCGPRTRGVR